MSFELVVHGGTRLSDLDERAQGRYDNHYYFRHGWVSEIAIEARGGSGSPQWTVTNQEGFRLSGGPNSWANIDGNRVLLSAGNAMRLNVTCRDGGVTREVVIWIVCARLDLRDNGLLSYSVERRLMPYLRRRYGLGPQQLVLGRQTWRFNRGGSDCSTRYGYAVELMASVTPRDVPVRFYVARRIANWFVAGINSAGRPLSQERGPNIPIPNWIGEDTSRFQAEYPEDGHLYDLDLPGSEFTKVNGEGDRHIWNVHFEQIVGIGNPQWNVPGGRSIWHATQTAARGVSDICRWSFVGEWSVRQAGLFPEVNGNLLALPRLW
jgi:hypothetical protein